MEYYKREYNTTLSRLVLLAWVIIGSLLLAYVLTPYGPMSPARVSFIAILISICGYLYKKSRSSVLAGLAALSFFALFLFASCYLLKITGPSDTSEAERAAKRITIRAQVEEDAHKRLTTVGWSDAAKGLARIPLTEAMKMEIDSLKTKPVRAANAIVVPPAPVAPAPAPAAATKPAAAPAAAAPEAKPKAQPPTLP